MNIRNKPSGYGILVSIGKYTGFYLSRGTTWRLCLGWVAITFVPFDGDFFIEALIHVGKKFLEREEQEAALKRLSEAYSEGTKHQ